MTKKLEKCKNCKKKREDHIFFRKIPLCSYCFDNLSWKASHKDNNFKEVMKKLRKK